MLVKIWNLVIKFVNLGRLRLVNVVIVVVVVNCGVICVSLL